MGYLSASVVLASVVYILIRPPPWMPSWFLAWRQIEPSRANLTAASESSSSSQSGSRGDTSIGGSKSQNGNATSPDGRNGRAKSEAKVKDAKVKDAALMPPPPPPTLNETPTLIEPSDETTPKALPSKPSPSVPTFSLDDGTSISSKAANDSLYMPPPSFSRPPPPKPSLSTSNKPPAGRMPSLSQFPAANSIQRARGPAPARGPPTTSSSGLTPPPTITSKPQKPSRKVLLEPGHSPLDWAAISGPTADLRGLPAETSYLRVTPSMLKEKTGRKGKDAWMAINGKVYNVTPYAKFHPGGIPELMRGAGKDGTKLFWEIHPWVNYDTMLAACLVGLLVEEPDVSGPSKMDEMD